MNIGKNEIVIKLKLDKNTDALKTIRALKSIEGYKSMSFHFKD